MLEPSIHALMTQGSYLCRITRRQFQDQREGATKQTQLERENLSTKPSDHEAIREDHVVSQRIVQR